MTEFLDNLATVFEFVFLLGSIPVLYLSLEKCFLKGKKGRVKLFFITLLTNPLSMLGLSVVILNAGYMILTETGVISEDSFNVLLSFSLWGTASLLFVVLTLIASCLVGIWLRAPNKSLVVFVYLMFTVFYSVMLRGYDSSSEIYGDISCIISMIGSFALFFAVWLLYHYVIRALSMLTDKKCEVNWKIFLITPNLYILVNNMISIFALTPDIGCTIAIYTFSTVIIYIFIWAFYVIIENINATNAVTEAKDEVKELSVEVMEALARTIDAKDKYTNGHSMRVAEYSRMIAGRMGLSADRCENIYYMGLLHDIGKIGVPNDIINKPARLTDNEYEIIKTHPGIGYSILSEIKSRPDLAIGALSHHERYDGRGYPERKSGGDIPLEARIIAVADTYDAMTSNRSYRKYLPQDVVRAEIEKNKGTQFDPSAAEAMLGIIDDDKDFVLHEKDA